MATTNTQFSELQKLLINVAENKCDAFIKTHINAAWEGPTETGELPEFNIAEGIDDVYYNKVVFLQKYNTIYTKGTFFGYNGDLKTGLQNGISANGITVKYNPDATDGPAIVTTVVAATYSNKTWNNPDNVVTGSTVKTYVDEQVATAVAEAAAAMEFKGSINSASELSKEQGTANNGDVWVVGTEFTVTSGDNTKTFEKGDLIIFRKVGPATSYIVVQKDIDGAVVKDTSWSGILTNERIAVATGSNTIKPTSYTIGGATFADSGNSYILATEAGVMAYVTSAIGAIDMDHSVTTLTPVSDNDYYSVTETGADDDNDYNYEIELNVVRLSDAVGMTYDETTGKWSAPEGSSVEDGLASAADVANELVSDEKVIAAALNDHEARIDALEDFVGDINGTIQDQLVIGEVTVDGLIATKTNDGLVNADLLVSVINALDPWQDYE